MQPHFFSFLSFIFASAREAFIKRDRVCREKSDVLAGTSAGTGADWREQTDKQEQVGAAGKGLGDEISGRGIVGTRLAASESAGQKVNVSNRPA